MLWAFTIALGLNLTSTLAQGKPAGAGKPDGVGGKPENLGQVISEEVKKAREKAGAEAKPAAEIAKIKAEFKAAREAQLEVLQKLRDEFKMASDDRKAEIKKELTKLREEWAATQKQNAKEVRERAKQIKEEFKNRERDRVVDATKDAAESARGR